jgi:acyl dehydratase
MVLNKFEAISEGNFLLEGVDGPVNRQAIRKYAETSGDRNPIHTTYKVAAAAGLRGVIQHGLFSMAWLIKTLTNWISNNGRLKKIDVQFRSMVRPNDMIHSKAQCIKKYQENGQKCVDLTLVQEAWSLLCRGVVQVSDKTIDVDMVQKALANAKLGMGLELEMANGEIKGINQERFELKTDNEKIIIVPNSLSFWEYFTMGWCRAGDKIQVKLMEPLEKGKAEFEMYKVSNSIEGTAMMVFY